MDVNDIGAASPESAKAIAYLERSRSRFVAQRFALKLVILLAVSIGFVPSLYGALGDLALLTGAMCSILAVQRGERPLARTLNYWDEACCFGLIACLA
jgi:hypothetical protein